MLELNDAFIDTLVRNRLADLRADAARRAMIRVAIPEGPALRTRLGLALIRLGRRLAEELPGTGPAYAEPRRRPI
jgi:hypothetical protein